MKPLSALNEFRLTERGLRRVLGPLEADVMEVLWGDSPLSIRDVHSRLPQHPDLAYTTVMTVIQRLHRKGFLKRRWSGGGHQYRPTLTREAFQEAVVAAVLSGLLRDFPEWTRRQTLGLWRHSSV